MLAVSLTLAGLTGCSGDVPGPVREGADAPAPSPRPTAVVTPTADPEAARLQALAQLAESAAAAEPTPSAPGPTLRPTGPVVGADISWPQCPEGLGIPQRPTLGLPMPLPSARYVVVGLTNGPGFTANPCLADQVAWVRDRHLLAAAYAVVSHPDGRTVAAHGGRGPFDADTRLGALANTGYQQALTNVATMRDAGLASPVVWVDVEHVPDFEWSGDLEANAAVVQGAVRGYQDAGYRVGLYSTQSLWADVVGDLALRLPEWRPAGETSRSEALSRCGRGSAFQGGRAVLAQWVVGQRDLDITCPGTAQQLGRWFQQY